MSAHERWERRRRMWLRISLVMVVLAVILVATEASLTRWLNLAVALGNLFVFWELRKSKPPTDPRAH